ncbi:hypothetical protein Q0F99_07485 [Rathayibacter oskolensis]|uniref:peptidase inhibitor family I36 protein n=1 Tax=Rathayibacter oskolensis TaxID=1891671 RepID=UPI00265F0DF2|nr:peptidase inhibitor family I36 protein [Rathayibacter oskolensis]WKK72745.1 hypothetical protein Q0F99_07485 [Rathayibacter oskolensis]
MSTTTGTPVRRSAAALGLSAALAAGALAPTAGADPLDATGAQNCIVITELARELCAPLGEDLDRKVLEETGLTVVDSTTAPAASRSSSPASAAATYVLARLYDDADYGGSSLSITDSSACNGITVKPTTDIGSGWYGRVSSFAVYNGCTVKIYETTGFGGSSYGYAGSTSYVGSAMNDRTRSLRAK